MNLIAFIATSLLSLSPIKDQGDNGFCWAFSSISMIENEYDSNLDLSEMSLSLATHGVTDIYEIERDSSTYNDAMYTLINYGVIDEYVLPYGSDCMDETMLNYKKLQLMNAYTVEISEIKNAILKYKSVGIVCNMDEKYYNSENNSYYSGTNYNNHSITIVSWDDNFKAVPGVPSDGAWLCRNSWGKNGYGLEGYFWLYYCEPSIGPYAYVFDAEEPYTYTYSNDTGKGKGFRYAHDEEILRANFVSKQDETLKAISFESWYENTNYEITVNGNTQCGTVSYKGYHTIVLDTPIKLKVGDSINISIKINNPEYSIMLMPLDGTGKARIKAYTDFDTPQAEKPKNISINNAATGVKLKWDYSAKDTGYYIYKKYEDGSWEYYDTTYSNSYLDEGVVNDTNYKYYIVGFNDYRYSDISKTVSIKYLSPISKIPKNRNKVEIQYATDKKFKHIVKKPKKFKRYWIRIRRRTGKYYSAWTILSQKKEV